MLIYDFGIWDEPRLQRVYPLGRGLAQGLVSIIKEYPSLELRAKVRGLVHFVAFSANLQWYQHTPILVEGPDDLLHNHPFRYLFIFPERKAPTVSANLKTVAVTAISICCS